MIVITGGAGFIGSNLVAALEARGEPDLVVCDVLGHGQKWRNLAKREIADIVAPDDLLAFLDAHANAVTAILHLGASSSTVETDVDFVLRNNFTFSLKLWDWCSAHDARLIYASSAATYGDGSLGFDDDGSIEALAKLRPLNAYGWSKHLFDRRVARLVADGAPRPRQWAGLKFFNAYGPNEYHKKDQRSLIAKTFSAANAGEAVRLFKSHDSRYADGGQLRDFVWVGDCVDVIVWLYDSPEVDGLFNVGTGQARTFKDLIEAMFHALDKPTAITYVDTPVEIRDQYQYFTQAETARLRAAGYTKEFTPLEEGVTEYVRAYLNGPDRYV